MPAWGVASGKGALNAQSIQDLVSYVETLATTSTKAQATGAAETQSCGADDKVNTRAACVGRKQLEEPATRAAADKWVVDAKAELTAAQAQLVASSVADVGTYTKLVEEKQDTLQAAEGWQQTTQNPTDGASLRQQLRTLPHPRLVVLRRQQSGRQSGARDHGRRRVTVRTSPAVM